MPRVSVIVPTYNSARFLGRAINSILAQTYTDYEIIVVDDGSTDDTRDVLRPFRDRVRYFFQANRGAASARNLALAQAGGELIAYLDADDMWYPPRLETEVAFLDSHRECGLVHSDATIIDERDHVLHPAYNADTLREVPHGHCALSLLRQCHVHVPTVLERRDCIDRVGGFDERLTCSEDYFHWIRIAMDGMAVGYIPEPLALYRRSTSSLSSSPRRMLKDYVIIFEALLADRSRLLEAGQEAMSIARGRLYVARRDLAYLDRLDGHTANALGHTIRLVRHWPMRLELYVDLLKTCVGPLLRLNK